VLSDGSSTYLYGHDRLATVTSTGTRTWPLHDALGSVRLSLDDTGTLLPSDLSYTPFSTPQSGALPAPFGFTGELHHDGLVYLRARWYDPGRRQQAVIAPAQQQPPPEKDQCQPADTSPDREIRLTNRHINGNQREPNQRACDQPCQRIGAHPTGAQEASKQTADDNAQEPEGQHGQRLLGQFARIGHAHAQAAQDGNHAVEPERDQRAGQHAREPVEQRKRDERKPDNLLPQEEQAGAPQPG
jgi:hypothetical protein